mgnify:CR=1 FL=1
MVDQNYNIQLRGVPNRVQKATLCILYCVWIIFIVQFGSALFCVGTMSFVARKLSFHLREVDLIASQRVICPNTLFFMNLHWNSNEGDASPQISEIFPP